MSDEKIKADDSQSARTPRRVRLPGFLRDEEIGLGDVIRKFTSAVGIQPCGSCQKRAEKLNSWVRFSR